jgi:hypothetical protein
MPKASVLIVSRTLALLNRLLLSIDQAYQGPAESLEILISWNGTTGDEKKIATGRLLANIAQRDPYHFAKNMNSLAEKVASDILIFANDDLIVDPGSIEAALDRLTLHPEVGLVGARLRTSQGHLAHAGIHFTSYGSPYHQLENFVDANHPASNREGYVPAVTGAFFAMRRHEFLEIRLTETFNVCGEDVLLSLDTRAHLRKKVLYCPAMSGIHDAESTRQHFEAQRANHDDQMRLRSAWLTMLEKADRAELLMELKAAQTEAEDLRNHQGRGLIAELQEQCKSLKEALEQEESASRKLNYSYQASETKLSLELALIKNENKRLRSRIQQLENREADHKSAHLRSQKTR